MPLSRSRAGDPDAAQAAACDDRPSTVAQYRPRRGRPTKEPVLRKALVMPVAAFAIAGLGATTAVTPAVAAPTAATSVATARRRKTARRTRPPGPSGLRSRSSTSTSSATSWARSSCAGRQSQGVGQRLETASRAPVRVRWQLRHQHRNGYYGAYQFAAGTWRGIGGGRYASYAHQAPKFAQDHMAYKLWKRSGWGPWGCA